MDNLENIILKALIEVGKLYEYKDRIDRKKSSCTGFSELSSIYPFTNENIAAYYSKFDFKDKRILTVLGSGDQVLNAILLGAKEIDCFDISIFANFYFALKKAAIKALTYEEFLDFFIEYNTVFEIKLYSKICKYLSPEIKKFWDSLYLEFSGYQIRKSDLFEQTFSHFTDEDSILKTNLYLNETEYYKLREVIDNCEVRFFNCDILSLSEVCRNDYDFIGLSNIYSRVWTSEKETLENEIVKLGKMLNKNGVIIIDYAWNKYDLDLAYLSYFFEKLGELKIMCFEVTKSFYNPSLKNSILYYENTELKREL